jgi:hypothetical protein
MNGCNGLELAGVPTTIAEAEQLNETFLDQLLAHDHNNDTGNYTMVIVMRFRFGRREYAEEPEDILARLVDAVMNNGTWVLMQLGPAAAGIESAVLAEYENPSTAATTEAKAFFTALWQRNEDWWGRTSDRNEGLTASDAYAGAKDYYDAYAQPYYDAYAKSWMDAYVLPVAMFTTLEWEPFLFTVADPTPTPSPTAQPTRSASRSPSSDPSPLWSLPTIYVSLTLLGGDEGALGENNLGATLRAGLLELAGAPQGSVARFTNVTTTYVNLPASQIAGLPDALARQNTFGDRAAGVYTRAVPSDDPLNARRLTAAGCTPLDLSEPGAVVRVPVTVVDLVIHVRYADAAQDVAAGTVYVEVVRAQLVAGLEDDAAARAALGGFVDGWSACTGTPSALGIMYAYVPAYRQRAPAEPYVAPLETAWRPLLGGLVGALVLLCFVGFCVRHMRAHPAAAAGGKAHTCGAEFGVVVLPQRGAGAPVAVTACEHITVEELSRRAARALAASAPRVPLALGGMLLADGFAPAAKTYGLTRGSVLQAAASASPPAGLKVRLPVAAATAETV